VSAHGAAPTLGRQPRSDRIQGRLFQAAMFFSLGLGIVALATLLVDVFLEGLPRLNGDLLSNFPSGIPENAGAQSAIFGTIWVI
jgi:phosphate transport system permease protein